MMSSTFAPCSVPSRKSPTSLPTSPGWPSASVFWEDYAQFDPGFGSAFIDGSEPVCPAGVTAAATCGRGPSPGDGVVTRVVLPGGLAPARPAFRRSTVRHP